MTSLNTRAAGQDFEGNGPSSFDRRSYRIEAADIAPLSDEVRAFLDDMAKVAEGLRGRPVKLARAA